MRAKGLDVQASWQERILGNARLSPGETLLDVGRGEGLIAFGALERSAEAVVFSDISQDLLDFCRHAAGFHPIHLELEAEIRPSEPMQWETFVSRAGNPRIPAIDGVLSQALTADERDRLAAHLRPLVEEGRGTWRTAVAYQHAVKPLSAGLD